MREKMGINESTGLEGALDAMTKFTPVKAEKKKEIVKKSDTIDALVKNRPEVKSEIKPETIEELKKKYKEEVKKELKLEDLKNDLSKIKGVEIVEDFAAVVDAGNTIKLADDIGIPVSRYFNSGFLHFTKDVLEKSKKEILKTDLKSKWKLKDQAVWNKVMYNLNIDFIKLHIIT